MFSLFELHCINTFHICRGGSRTAATFKMEKTFLLAFLKADSQIFSLSHLKLTNSCLLMLSLPV